MVDFILAIWQPHIIGACAKIHKMADFTLYDNFPKIANGQS